MEGEESRRKLWEEVGEAGEVGSAEPGARGRTTAKSLSSCHKIDIIHQYITTKDVRAREGQQSSKISTHI